LYVDGLENFEAKPDCLYDYH